MLKNIAILLLFASAFVYGEELQTSNDLNNLEIVTEADCLRDQTHSDQHQQKKAQSGELQVETVNYKLHLCDGERSFPVTVRSQKMRGVN